ncbi:MAG: gamma-glutamylcyclotransferase family protein [Rhodospirillaceae bacterium]
MARSEPIHQLAMYGLLRTGQPGYIKFKLERRLRKIGISAVSGTLYDAGGYPALVPGPGKVVVEVFRSLDPKVLEDLDRYEGFNQDRPHQSLYRRVLLELPDDWGSAWCYVYNRPVRALPIIRSGDWLARRI